MSGCSTITIEKNGERIVIELSKASFLKIDSGVGYILSNKSKTDSVVFMLRELKN